jgi:GNAT superfamily N-acetyltransferase
MVMEKANQEIRLLRVYPAELENLKEYVQALYAYDEDFDAMVNIEDGVKSLLRQENLATAYFIMLEGERIGYVILTRYHSVEKGGLTFYIDELYVEEVFRRKGVGAKIIEKIFDIARIEGAKGLWAQAEPYNKAAQEFFIAQGFQVNPYLNFEMTL